MRIENKIAISILVILVGFPCLVFASASANYENSSETVSTAGGEASSANFSTFGTVGEVVTGTSESTNYQSSAGFVITVIEAAVDPYDPNESGGTTMADVLICYKQYLGLPTGYPPADVDGGGVTMRDVLKIYKRYLLP